MSARSIARVVLLAGVLATGPGVAEDRLPLALVYRSEVSCPDRAALVGALERRGTEIVDAERSALQLELGMRGTDLLVALRDRGGAVLAERAIPVGACDALADAVALLVERRVQGIDWEGTMPGRATAPEVRPPATPSAPPRGAEPERPASPTSLQAHAGVSYATDIEDHRGRAGPGVGLRLLPPGIADIALSFAWQRFADLSAAGGASFDVDRFPIALSSTLALRRARWEARAGASIEADILSMQSHVAHPASAVRAALRLGPTAELALSPFESVWVGLGARLPLKIIGYELVIDGIGTVGRQSPVAIELGLWLGYRFHT